MDVSFCLNFCPSSEAPLVRSGLVASGQLPPGMPPFRFFVHRGIGDTPHGANETAVGANDVRGKLGSRRFVHEGHELIRKSRHGASDADAAHIGAAANPAHPAALGYIAVHHWSPAAQLYQALRRSVVGGKVALLVIRTAIAP